MKIKVESRKNLLKIMRGGIENNIILASSRGIGLLQ
jgi:hypothetical protein